MYKKYNCLVTILILLAIPLNFAAESHIEFNKDRYEAIVEMFEKKQLRSDNVAADIQIIEDHKKSLETKLAAEKKKGEASYIPTLLKVAGGSFGFAAAIGGIASMVGAVGAFTILNRPENAARKIFGLGSLYATGYVNLNPGESDSGYNIVTGMTYLELLKLKYYDGLLRGKYPSLDDWDYDITGTFLSRLSYGERSLVSLGLLVPLITIGSLVSAGISKYFFNKAARYKIEIVKLENEIKRDDAIIKALAIF